MSWGEAYRLTEVLLADPSSPVAAAVYEWKMPVSPEWLVLADIWDALSHRVYKNPKPYQRPFARTSTGRKMRPQREIRKSLARRGHAELMAEIEAIEQRRGG